MNWLIDRDDPAFKAFADGWEKWVEHTSAVGLYWNPAKVRWATYSPHQFVMTQTDYPAVDVGYFAHPSAIWPKLTVAWDHVRVQRPDAVWSPHSYRWYLPRTPGPPGPGPGGSKAMQDELDRVDALYMEGKISAAERQRLRNEIFERYY